MIAFSLQVCKQWKTVVEEFVTLQYIVWLGIYGHQMPGPSATGDTVAVRLEKLRSYTNTRDNGKSLRFLGVIL
jgi:hypothetical protein